MLEVGLMPLLKETLDLACSGVAQEDVAILVLSIVSCLVETGWLPHPSAFRVLLIRSTW